MNIEESRAHIEHFYGVKIDERTMKIIDEQKLSWVAMAQTEGNEQVALLAAGTGVFMIYMEDRHKYGAWFNAFL